MPIQFQDLFSSQSKTYAQFRPTYPQELFDYLASLTPSHETAWDCGTGNGQAAISLKRHFIKVWATDPSSAQISNAVSHKGVTYLVGAETQDKIENHSVDLITVAQALHWFQFDRFYSEVRRVATPGAIIAAWAYDFNQPIQPAIDSILNKLYFETLGPYWAPNNKLIWDGYKDIPFPFERIATPKFQMKANLNLVEFLGYLASWSSSAKFLEKNGYSALKDVYEQVLPLWGAAESKKLLQWNLHLLVGRVDHPNL